MSAYKLQLFPEILGKRLLIGGFIIYMLLVFSATFILATFGDSCENIGRLIFAVVQMVYAVVFGIVCYLILRTVNRSAGRRKALSQSFMIRYTRPLTFVLIVYTWTSTINLGLQVFLYNTARLGHVMSCHQTMENESIEVQISYPIFKQIDLLVPIWAILWFFFSTTKKESKSVTPLLMSARADESSYTFDTPIIMHSSKPVHHNIKPLTPESPHFTGYSTTIRNTAEAPATTENKGLQN